MDAIERTVRLDGRLFRVEALHDAVRGVWHAVVGEGWEPRRWTRLPLPYDTAEEALAAAAGGIVRLVGTPGLGRSDAGRSGSTTTRETPSSRRLTSQGNGVAWAAARRAARPVARRCRREVSRYPPMPSPSSAASR